jgi:hypothetical protein
MPVRHRSRSSSLRSFAGIDSARETRARYMS